MTSSTPSLSRTDRDGAGDDTDDFADADRGFIARLDPGVVHADDGRVIWDNDAYAFLAQECPDTAHPGLWRQGRLTARQGLYQVTEGIYQVRGLDLSTMTLVEGDRGVIVIDPLISAETAAAALGLYRRHRGERPVTGLIYTHSHGDHFGGARGVLPHGHEPVPVLAPQGFLAHCASENIYAGNAMTRRAVYMYGAQLPKTPTGQIGCGLGMTTSTGTVTLIAPTVDVTRTGQVETVDGVRMVFQLTPGTEAPAEMNFHFPDRKALCLAENATHTMHNVLTLRGAEVRDARVWARYLDEALTLFGAQSEVSFASHHWPTWGRERIVRHLTEQRDLYAYLHDQTLRLLNTGLTGAEIAERLELPPGLESRWALRGYYGSLSHNVKAIYQRYMGWFDGNPAHLWEHPPTEQARRYTDALGGVAAAVATATRYADDGDLRFAATLLNHAVLAAPDHQEARQRLATVYDALGYGCENGTWRNFYLTAAMELRGTPATVELSTTNPEVSMALTVSQLIDAVAVRINGPRAWDDHLTVDLLVSDERRGWRLTLSNGALTHRSATLGRPLGEGPADLALTLSKAQLLGLLGGGAATDLEQSGDPQVLARLLSYLDTPDPNFPLVTR
ncbi:alkyl sulfatase dimerization domain-containing protein [Kitasatospora nipponensis]|uniref:Alkyl sulfatase dimerization domain-containing protein n=1 Tax=Kitasatospora nipponensis TaxID=258049 RepID=A0ABN1WZA8_9ACTN